MPGAGRAASPLPSSSEPGSTFATIRATGVGVGVAVGGTGVAVGGTGVAVGGTGVAVGGTGVAVGGTGVAVGGTGVAVGGTGVAVGGTGVAVGGTGVAVGVGAGTPPQEGFWSAEGRFVSLVWLDPSASMT